jgi:hypothetical protein
MELIDRCLSWNSVQIQFYILPYMILNSHIRLIIKDQFCALKLTTERYYFRK